MADQSKISPEQLLKLAKLMQSKGESEEQQMQQLTEFALGNMTGSQGEQLNKILSDQQAVESLIKSRAAQTLLKNLTKNG